MRKQPSYPILIASVLKPWDDHRMYEKWALFFKESFSSEIHIFGRAISVNETGIFSFHKSMQEESLFSRINALWIYLKLLVRKKPRLVVVTSFELLLPSFLFYVLSLGKTKFFYDVQENYELNYLDKSSRATLKKYFGRFFIRFNENISLLFIKKYFYSDAIYATQLHFLRSNNSYLIENLYSFPDKIEAERIKNSYLLTGTLSKAYGLDLAISWIRKIIDEIPDAKVKILGHLTDNYLFPEDIKMHCDLTIPQKPIAHKDILEEIAAAEYLLLPYSWSKSFIACTPVKLYEALFLGTKVICSFEDNLANKIRHPYLQFIPYFENKEIREYAPKKFRDSYYPVLKNIFSYYFE